MIGMKHLDHCYEGQSTSMFDQTFDGTIESRLQQKNACYKVNFLFQMTRLCDKYVLMKMICTEIRMVYWTMDMILK